MSRIHSDRLVNKRLHKRFAAGAKKALEQLGRVSQTCVSPEMFDVEPLAFPVPPTLDRALGYRGNLRFVHFGYSANNGQFEYCDGGDDIPSTGESVWRWFLGHPLISPHVPKTKYPTLYGIFPPGPSRPTLEEIMTSRDLSFPAHELPEHHYLLFEEQSPEQKHQKIESALNYSREKNVERQAVVDERDLLRDSLRRSMAYASFAEVREGFEHRTSSGDLIEKETRSPARAFTTDRMMEYERDTIAVMRAGQNQFDPLANSETWREVDERHSHLSASQRAAVEKVLSSQDKVVAIEGAAGAGKTTALSAIREAAEQEGYEVRGLAPTSRVAHKLAESGIESGTLQRHLVREEQVDQKRLYILDESSLASTKQMNEFLHRVRDEDRVILVGDKRQHEAVEAGRPYQQLQEAGMQTARLDEIVRQKDPALKEVVEQLSRGNVFDAINGLDAQGRVHEIVNRKERLTEIACEYAREPKGTLVISPDNESRHELNTLVHRAMQERGDVRSEENKLRVLDSRQEMTGADRQWASQYESGDVVRYSHGSRLLGIEPGEYARVKDVDAKQNRITVERENGVQESYDPRRLSGVAVYQEVDRAFSEGDRVQFTAPSRDLHVANRELGTIQKVNDAGDLEIRMDSGCDVTFNIREHPHLDHGYAVTSHSSQGQTADRVLVHVDTDKSELLVNNRFAYVSVSRGQYDAQIYTDNRSELARDLSRDLARPTATEAEQRQDSEQMNEPRIDSKSHEPEQEQAHGIGLGVA
jgi:AAA domain